MSNQNEKPKQPEKPKQETIKVVSKLMTFSKTEKTVKNDTKKKSS